MRRIGFAIALFAIVMFSASVAFAAKPSGAGGGSPHVISYTCEGSGSTFTCTGKIAGLGSGWTGADVTGTVSATYDVTCVSPGGNAAAGIQNKTSPNVPATGSLTGPEANGQYTFTLTGSVDTSHAKAFGCPNNNWTAEISNFDNITITSLTVTLDGNSVDIKL